jgi:hypothetical protein
MTAAPPREQTMPDYQHAEAFCLMKYRSNDGTEEELIWNSRDGVTPFAITLRSGKRATHVDWQNDQRMPDYQPPAGSRMFVDLTPERARELAERDADMYPQHGSRKRAIKELMADYLRLGMPDIAEAGRG